MTMLAEVVDTVIGTGTRRDSHRAEIADAAGWPIAVMRIGNDSAGFAQLLAAIAELAPGPRILGACKKGWDRTVARAKIQLRCTVSTHMGRIETGEGPWYPPALETHAGGPTVAERAFVIMQVGAKDSPERKRADEIYEYIIAPAVEDASLEPYRADLDLSPGAITPKMLSELLSARVVIADLTGRNPNVFYELGITHSFARPLISIADSSSSLPFDAKDERVIELGEYPPTGLAYAQGEQAKASLQESLKIVLGDEYSPPSPLREVAANRSVDQLAPENPVAAEMAQMRETLEEIRKRMTPRVTVPRSTRADIEALRDVIERNASYLDGTDFGMLSTEDTSSAQDNWTNDLRRTWNAERRLPSQTDDPWASEASTPKEGTTDEPPF